MGQVKFEGMIELNLKLKGGTHGFTLKFLVDKATTFADVGSWIAFNVILDLLLYGNMLFPNMEGFMDLASIHIFMTKSHVPTLLYDTYYSIHARNLKKKGTIMFYVHMLYIYFMSHLPKKGTLVEKKDNLKWSQRIMSLTAKDILWYSRCYDDV